VQFVVYLAVVTTGLSYIIDTLPHTQVPHSCQMTLLGGGGRAVCWLCCWHLVVATAHAFYFWALCFYVSKKKKSIKMGWSFS